MKYSILIYTLKTNRGDTFFFCDMLGVEIFNRRVRSNLVYKHYDPDTAILKIIFETELLEVNMETMAMNYVNLILIENNKKA